MGKRSPYLGMASWIKTRLEDVWRSIWIAYQTPIPRYLLEHEMRTPKIQGVKLRTYSPDDFAACREIHDLNVPNRFPEDSKIQHEEYLQELPETNLVAEMDGKVIGCGGYILNHPDYVTFVYGLVHPHYQRIGVGRLLFFGRIAQLQLLESDTIIVICTVKAALPYFKKYGFVVQPSTWKDTSGLEHPIAMAAVNSELIQRARSYLERVGVEYPDLRASPVINSMLWKQALAEQQKPLNPSN